MINLTNHTYFNLAGEASGDVCGPAAVDERKQYTPADTNLIPESRSS